jgi:hypothetical protein
MLPSAGYNTGCHVCHVVQAPGDGHDSRQMAEVGFRMLFLSQVGKLNAVFRT